MQIDEKTLHDILHEVDLNKNGQVELIEFLQVRISLFQRNCNCYNCRHRCSVPLLLPSRRAVLGRSECCWVPQSC